MRQSVRDGLDPIKEVQVIKQSATTKTDVDQQSTICVKPGGDLLSMPKLAGATFASVFGRNTGSAASSAYNGPYMDDLDEMRVL